MMLAPDARRKDPHPSGTLPAEAASPLVLGSPWPVPGLERRKECPLWEGADPFQPTAAAAGPLPGIHPPRRNHLPAAAQRRPSGLRPAGSRQRRGRGRRGGGGQWQRRGRYKAGGGGGGRQRGGGQRREQVGESGSELPARRPGSAGAHGGGAEL